MIALSLSPLPDILSKAPDTANLQSVCASTACLYDLSGATENLFCLIFQPLLPDHLYHASVFTKASSVLLKSISFVKSFVFLITISFYKTVGLDNR